MLQTKLRKKDTGDISVFTNKDNYEKALDSGDYEEPEDGEKKPQIKKQETSPLFQKDGKTDDNLKNTGGLVKVSTVSDETAQEEGGQGVDQEKIDTSLEYTKTQYIYYSGKYLWQSG